MVPIKAVVFLWQFSKSMSRKPVQVQNDEKDKD